MNDLIKEAEAYIKAIQPNQCGYTQELIQRLTDKLKKYHDNEEFAENVSDDVAKYVMGHLSSMYPEQYKLFTPSMRKSIKGCLYNAWKFHIDQLPKPPEENT